MKRYFLELGQLLSLMWAVVIGEAFQGRSCDPAARQGSKAAASEETTGRVEQVNTSELHL